MNTNAQITDPSYKAVLCPIADDASLTNSRLMWERAVLALIQAWTAKGECYSSGRLCATMREHRADKMVFSCPSVGEVLKNLFYSGQLPDYVDENGDSTPVVMVPRITEGLYPDRTPAGVEVFVYGPNAQACMTYEFEVFIPNPMRGETMASAPAPAVAQTVQAANDPTGRTKTAVAILGTRLANQSPVAAVWPDGRLCIPRTAFEALVHLSGSPMRGGDPVYVTIEGTKITVNLEPTGDPKERSYDLSLENGRIAITFPFKILCPKDAYAIEVTADNLIVDLSKPA